MLSVLWSFSARSTVLLHLSIMLWSSSQTRERCNMCVCMRSVWKTKHTHLRTQTHTHTHTHRYTHTHTHTHTHTPTHSNTHTHAHTHTHSQTHSNTCHMPVKI